jgi:hypothetical protein
VHDDAMLDERGCCGAESAVVIASTHDLTAGRAPPHVHLAFLADAGRQLVLVAVFGVGRVQTLGRELEHSGLCNEALARSSESSLERSDVEMIRWHRTDASHAALTAEVGVESGFATPPSGIGRVQTFVHKLTARRLPSHDRAARVR